MIAYFDCSSGVSGDMLLASLIKAGASVSYLRKKLSFLPVKNWDIETALVEKKGLPALQIKIKGQKYFSSPRVVLDLVEKSNLPSPLKNRIGKIFNLLADAEAEVHQIDKQQVHFHEIASLDTIVDIAGTVLALENLKVEEVYSSPLNVGSPAPATLTILENRKIPIYSTGNYQELVTPTGSAIIATLAKSFGPMPLMTIEKFGLGAGVYELNTHPNILRFFIGKKQKQIKQFSFFSPLYNQDEVLLLEANIDDMNPQLFPYVMDKLFAGGALDVWFTPIQMKKGRPAILLSALGKIENQQKLVKIFLEETTSLGVRILPLQRIKLYTQKKQAEIAGKTVAAKIGFSGKESLRQKLEFADWVKVKNKRGQSRFLLTPLFIFLVIFIPGLLCGWAFPGNSKWKWYSSPSPGEKSAFPITALAVDGNLLWVGTKNRLWSLDKDKNKWISYDQVNGRINTILADRKTVWVATAREVDYLNKENGRWEKLAIPQQLVGSGSINTLIYRGDDLWIGTEGGLVEGKQVLSQNQSFYLYNQENGLSANQIKSLLAVGDNLFVLSTGSDVDVRNLKTKTWQKLSSFGEAISNYLDLVRVGENLYLATNGAGVREYNLLKKEWKYYTTENGLGNNFAQTIASDGQYLWIGTLTGLNSLNTSNGRWRIFNSEITEGKLKESAIIALAVDGNYLWIGTEAGLCRFDKQVPQVALDIGCKEYEGGKENQAAAISLQGLVESKSKIKNLKVTYRSSVLPVLWLDKGIRIVDRQGKKKGLIGINWDLSDWAGQEDTYFVKLEAADVNNKFNTALDFIKIKKAAAQLLARIYFAPGESEIKARYYPILDKVAELLEDKQHLSVRIFYASHQELSPTRALNIFFYLAAKNKIASRRFSLIGDDEENEENQRVDIYTDDY